MASVTLNNALYDDLHDIFKKVRKRSELKARGNPNLESFVITESMHDAEMIFDYLYSAATYVADKTRAISDTTMSGLQAIRDAYLNYDFGNVEVINFPEADSMVKRDANYEYCINALIHHILRDWYRECGAYDIAQLEEQEAMRFVSLLNDNSTKTKLYKTPYIPAW